MMNERLKEELRERLGVYYKIKKIEQTRKTIKSTTNLSFSSPGIITLLAIRASPRISNPQCLAVMTSGMVDMPTQSPYSLRKRL